MIPNAEDHSFVGPERMIASSVFQLSSKNIRDSRFANCKSPIFVSVKEQFIMKKNNGMRPQDIVVLIKIAANRTGTWMMKDLAHELGISASEISESLTRSVYAGLLSADKRRIMRTALLEFLEHGLRYVYPQQPGKLVRGIVTAYSALPLANEIQSDEPVVWPYAEGNIRGQAIEPLHPNVPLSCTKDRALHELLALVDTLRIGKARERKIAIAELEKRL